MKTIGAGLQSHLGSEVTTTATLWKITRKDGVIMGFTDHDVDIVFSGVTYKASTGMTPTNIETQGNLAVPNQEVQGIFGTVNSEDITELDLLRGVYDEAKVEIMLVNYSNIAQGAVKLRKGYIGEVKADRGTFSAEMRGLPQVLQQQIVNVVQPSCRYDLGDSKCGINLASFTVNGAVTTQFHRGKFGDNATAAITSKANGWFRYGLVTWTSGNNDGLSMEVKSFTASGGVIELVQKMPQSIGIGDTFSIYAGCDKSAFGTNGCKLKFNNMINFGGEPHVPGEDTLFKYPDAH